MAALAHWLLSDTLTPADSWPRYEDIRAHASSFSSLGISAFARGSIRSTHWGPTDADSERRLVKKPQNDRRVTPMPHGARYPVAP
jgi:hypothetical protein